MKNKVCCITGASKGIGAAIAEKLLQLGSRHLILISRRSTAYEKTINRLNAKKSSDQKITAFYQDLSLPSGVIGLTKKLVKINDNIDIIINNAGFTAPNTIFETTLEDFQQTINVNLFAPFLLIQQLLQHQNKFSHIINIASTAGIRGRSGWSTYSASKAALIAFSQALREELLQIGTRVICLSPGRCATDLRKRLAPKEDADSIMQPNQVANVVATLLSNVGQLIDSENIIVRL